MMCIDMTIYEETDSSTHISCKLLQLGEKSCFKLVPYEVKFERRYEGCCRICSTWEAGKSEVGK